jgi:sugar phosphate isomerase/epimerase
MQELLLISSPSNHSPQTPPAGSSASWPKTPPAKQEFSRRQLLARAGLIAGAACLGQETVKAAEGHASTDPFRLCLNTATIRGQNVGIVKEIEIAAQAGYQSIEPWISSIEDYTKKGGSLADLKKRIADSGLTVESAIAFPEWMADDATKRAKGTEQAKREMAIVAEIGGKRLAAPPVGATNTPGLDLFKAAEWYRGLLDAGDQIGVVPELELWGFSKNLHLLSECAFVAIQTGHPKACVLCDMFHLYKGGSDFHTLRLLSGNAIQVFHMNDYPAEPPRDQINDSYRVFPGEGSAPLVEVLRTLRATGGQTILSLEVFNKTYWEQDALTAARTGLERMKAVVQQAVA